LTDPRTGAIACEVESREGYVVARLTGSMRSVGDAHQVQQKIERALRSSGHALLLMDNRLTGVPAVEARESMWAWCHDSPLIERAALLLESELSLVRANMTAVGKRTPLRSFGREDEAVAWLIDRKPKPAPRWSR
jgi:hypothetical protein